jgi:serine/threonine protein kinase
MAEGWLRAEEALNVRRKLGVGRDAGVYECEGVQDGEVCAVKVAKPGCIRQLMHEASVLHLLNDSGCESVPLARHHNVGIDHPTDSSFRFLSMEPLGNSLAELTLPLGEEALADVGFELLTLLEHVHRRGIVHADVKPANIVAASSSDFSLLSSNSAGSMRNRLRLLDFAIARGPGLADLAHSDGPSTFLVNSPRLQNQQQSQSQSQSQSQTQSQQRQQQQQDTAPLPQPSNEREHNAPNGTESQQQYKTAPEHKIERWWKYGVPMQSVYSGYSTGGEFGSSRYSSPYAMDREAVSPVDDLYSVLYTLTVLSGHRLRWHKDRDAARAASRGGAEHEKYTRVIREKKLEAMDDPSKLVEDTEDPEKMLYTPAPLVRYANVLQRLDRGTTTVDRSEYSKAWYHELKAALLGGRVPGCLLDNVYQRMDISDEATGRWLNSLIRSGLDNITPPGIEKIPGEEHWLKQIMLMRCQLMERLKQSPHQMLSSLESLFLALALEYEPSNGEHDVKWQAYVTANHVNTTAQLLRKQREPVIKQTEYSHPYHREYVPNPQPPQQFVHSANLPQQHPPPQAHVYAPEYSAYAHSSPNPTRQHYPPPYNLHPATAAPHPHPHHRPPPHPPPGHPPSHAQHPPPRHPHAHPHTSGSPRRRQRKRQRSESDDRSFSPSKRRPKEGEHDDSPYKPPKQPDERAEHLAKEEQQQRANAQRSMVQAMIGDAPDEDVPTSRPPQPQQSRSNPSRESSGNVDWEKASNRLAKQQRQDRSHDDQEKE